MAQANDSQMLKGVLQGCLLMLLHTEPSYGYAITQQLAAHGFAAVPKGTVYPLLMTMAKKGLLESFMQASPDGPERKYYRLTAAGEAERTAFGLSWRALQQNVDEIIEKVATQDGN
ncbi:PadR family transcriptional regulator [Lacticaseibacillus absianus]|uniref:PadR family transcriptional regulator n=1 Tax=Lacticaseibacillus absianus TaxID=2729623 RepID=UPI0015CE8AD4|nr:PadR family transcriptional regulator [Lacticaseibacillus absianus]